MWILRVVLAFIGAVIVTTVLGAIFHTQFILARLVDIGIDIPFAERWATTLHDIGGMAPLFGAVIALGFLVAFIAGALVYHWAGVQRNLVYAVAGAVAIAVALGLMSMVYEMTPIASARSWAGFLSQMAAGALGGLAFAFISRPHTA